MKLLRNNGDLIFECEPDNFLKELSGNRLNLEGSNLWGSNLGGSRLWGSNLAGSNLKGLNLAGSNLKGSNLS